MYSDLLLLLPSLLGFLVLLWRDHLRATPPDGDASLADKSDGLPDNPIVVDGSNVMHWGKEPSADVLRRVLRALEKKGYSPVIVFDANVGYVLGDRYYNEIRLAEITGVPTRQICVVHKGDVADEFILTFASKHNLRVVTNDQYRDWRVQFPHADKKGTLLRGTWREGAVVWRGAL